MIFISLFLFFFCCPPKWFMFMKLYKLYNSQKWGWIFCTVWQPSGMLHQSMLVTSYEGELNFVWDYPSHVSKFYCNTLIFSIFWSFWKIIFPQFNHDLNGHFVVIQSIINFYLTLDNFVSIHFFTNFSLHTIL